MKLAFSKEAKKFFDRASEPLKGRLDKALGTLQTQSFPPGCKKMVGGDGFYRIKVGRDYRVIYAVEREAIYIDKIAHRNNIYKKWFY